MALKFLQVLVVNTRPLRQLFLCQVLVQAQFPERVPKVQGNLVH